MKPHEERVVVEADELAIKVQSLTDFMDGNYFKESIDSEEQFRLTNQLTYMNKYLRVLKERIENFK